MIMVIVAIHALNYEGEEELTIPFVIETGSEGTVQLQADPASKFRRPMRTSSILKLESALAKEDIRPWTCNRNRRMLTALFLRLGRLSSIRPQPIVRAVSFTSLVRMPDCGPLGSNSTGDVEVQAV